MVSLFKKLYCFLSINWFEQVLKLLIKIQGHQGSEGKKGEKGLPGKKVLLFELLKYTVNFIYI